MDKKINLIDSGALMTRKGPQHLSVEFSSTEENNKLAANLLFHQLFYGLNLLILYFTIFI